MKITVSVLLIAFLPMIISGQSENKVDSLLNAAYSTKLRSQKIDALNEIAWHFRKSERDTAFYFIKQALKENYNEEYLRGKVKSYNILGVLLYYQSDYNESINYLKKAYGLSLKIKDSINIAKLSNNIGTIYQMQGHYTQAAEYNIASLRIKEKMSDTTGIINSLINISSLYYQLNKFEEGIGFYKRALNLANIINYPNKAIILNGLGSLYNEVDKYDTALICLNQALGLNVLAQNRKGAALNYHNIAGVYSNMGDTQNALEYYNKSLEIKQELQDEQGVAKTKMGIGELSYQMGNYQKAVEDLKHAGGYYLKIDQPYELKPIYKFISLSYNKMSNNDSAFKYLYKAYELYDTLYPKESKKIIEEIEERYQTQQKENEILRLNIENNEKKASLAQSRLLNVIGAGIVLLIILAGLFFWHRKKQRLKVILLQNSMQAGEREKKRVGRELHDGIAATLIKLAKDTGNKDPELSGHLFKTYNEVRGLSHQLNNSPIHGEAFIDRIIDLIPGENDDRHFSFRITPVALEIKEPTGTHLYRIIQELIANNLKHAQATKTNISVSHENKSLHLSYEDNGVGIAQLKKGNGFKNMESRIELMQGKMEVLTGLSTGLKIEMNIPYHNEKD